MLKKENIQNIYPLSPMQEGMFFHALYDKTSPVYFEQLSFRLHGELNISLVEKSINELFKRYDILRTVFVRKTGDRLLQVVLKQRDADFRFKDISLMDEEERNGYLAAFKEEDRRNVFDLAKDVLMRVTVFRTAPASYEFVWSHHHILMDGWCMGIVIGDFWEIYGCYRDNLSLQLPPVKQYREYLRWLDERDREASGRYWETYLQGYEVPARIPTVTGPASEGNEFEQAAIVIRLDEEKTMALERLAGENHVTVNTVFQTLWAFVLGCYSGSGDVVFGAVVSGRPPEIEGVASMVGLFINTVPVRISWQEDMSFQQLLEQVGRDAVDSEAHHYYPLVDIQAGSALKKELIDHIIVFQNFPIERQVAGEGGSGGAPAVEISHVESFERTNYDLIIVVTPMAPFSVKFDFNGRRYDSWLMERVARQVEYLLHQAVEMENPRMREFSLLSDADKKELLEDFNDTDKEYPSEFTMYRLFEEQVERTGDAVAVISMEHGDGREHGEAPPVRVTYRELYFKADLFARELIEKGVIPGDIVALLLTPSVRRAAAILGILKTGAAYLPIDAAYPGERIRYMLADSDARLLLTTRPTSDENGLVKSWGENRKEILYVEDIEEGEKFHHSSFVTLQYHSGLPAYIIYTSGTTGRPKGVAVRHVNAVNTLLCRKDAYRLSTSDVVLQLFSYVFDGFITGFFTPLISGAVLISVSDEQKKDPALLAELITRYRVSHFICVPPLYRAILECLSPGQELALTTVTLAGDRLSDELLEFSRQKVPAVEIINEYGVTEAAVMSTMNRHQERQMGVTIGKPAWNTAVYILGAQDRLLPVGVPGELCIAGAGLSMGYLNNPELTAERFIDLNRALESHRSYLPVEKLYKTGDLARLLPDGTVEYLGRIDHQVKIRGFRIEPGEIEARLSEHEMVREALVCPRTDPSGEKSLCAYFIPAGGGGADAAALVGVLQAHLEKLLPPYMVPPYFVPLEVFPLTPTGKIDRRALPDPLEIDLGISVEYEEPHTVVEKKLVDIWQAVLGRTHVGIHENFFTIGGDSIKSIQVSSRMTQAGYHVEMKDILKRPTIAKLAPYAKKLERTPDQGPVAGPVPLTPIQARFFRGEFAGRNHFNQSVMLFSKERFSLEAMRRVFKTIWEHHDALRMTFREENGKVIQTNNGPDHPMFFQVCDLRGRASAADALTAFADEIQQSMNLETGPLMKPAVIHMDDGDRLLIVCHHLVIDGVSWRILFEDIGILYHGYLEGESPVLPLKSDSFKYWAERLLEYADSSAFLKEIEWWAQVEARTAAPIPCDFAGGSNYKKDLKAVGISLDSELTGRLLTEVNRAYNTEINDILLAALAYALYLTFGLTEVAVAQEAHGRENILPHISLHRTVGWFTSLYPIVITLPEDEYLADTGLRVMEVKETLRRIPHKGIGYGILKYLTSEDNKKDITFQLTPRISFNYLGQFGTDLEAMPFSVAPEWAGNNFSMEGERDFQLDVSGQVTHDSLQLTVGFSSKQYRPETIRLLLDNYKTSLVEIVDFCAGIREYVSTPSDFTFRGLSIDELAVMKVLVQGDIEDIYTLSPMQEGMLFHGMLQPDSFAYFTQISFRLQGEMNVPLMQRSLEELFRRYGVLRTVFIHQSFDVPLQVVMKEMAPGFLYRDIFETLAGDPLSREEHVAAFKEEDRRLGFDLTTGPLMRLSVIRIESDVFDCTWSFHHVLMDGWCSGILVREFFDIYSALVEERPVQLPPVTPFVDYIRWLEDQDKDRAEAYWAAYLEGYETTARVPDAGNIPGEEANRYVYCEREYPLAVGLTRRLNLTAAREHVTLNTLLQAAWGVVLSRYNRTRDVVFGAVVSGRPAEIRGVETMVGLFINTVPVRVAYDADTTFTQLLRKRQDEAIQSDSVQHFPLASAQGLTPLKQDLLDNIMVFENFPMVEQLDGMAVRPESGHKGPAVKVSDTAVFEQTNYDFNLTVLPGRRLTIGFKYNGAVYSETHIQRIFGHLSQVLAQAADNPDALIDTFALLSEEERKQVISDFNDTGRRYAGEMVLSRLFEEQAARTPGNTAVIAAGRKRATLTYRELNEQTDLLAARLVEKGVRPGSIVAVKLDPSLALAVALLGVLKAGAAYLPIDPAAPGERIRYILADSNANMVLTGEDINGILAANTGGGTRPAVSPKSSDLAYIIYTSGSTGRPKGVAVKHSGISNYINWRIEYFRYMPEDVSLQLFSYVFDGFATNFYSPLLSGGAVVLLGDGRSSDYGFIRETAAAERVTNAEMVPGMCELILDAPGGGLDSMIFIVLGGEKASARLVERITSEYPSIQLYNEYGPTETSVGSTVNPALDAGNTAVIGFPAANYRTYVLGLCLEPLPIGVPGELCIAGDGLARGYLNNPELTAERFVDLDRTYKSYRSYFPEEKLYKTGDLVRRLPDGALEFLGRLDHQVKVRGYRIALGEIEEQLTAHEKVREAVVTVIENNNGEKSLCTYIVPLEPGNAASLEPGMWREYLLEFLPAYMVPSYFVMLQELPRTSTGKVDRRALPEPGETAEVSGIYSSPKNDMEKLLVQIWEKVLGRSPVGITDDFFAMGGDSIKAIQFLSQLSKTGYKVEMRQLFDNPTISLLAPNVEAARRTADQSEVTGAVPLTPIQAEFFEIHRQNNHHYNQSLVLGSGEWLDPEILRRVFVRISEHHDALRLTFLETDGKVTQVNRGSDQPVSLEVFDLRGMENPAAVLESHSDRIQSSIDLENGPLMKSAVFHMDNGDRLLIIAHHLVIDGVSWRILLEDIVYLYQSYKNGEENPQLPAKTDSFQSWARRLVEYAGSGSLLEEKEYWKQVQNSAPAPVIKNDFPGGGNNVGDSDVCYFQLSKEETAQLLGRVHTAFGTEIDDILLTALGLAVKEKYGGNHLFIAMEGHGRESILPDTDVTRTVGWFTSLYPVCLDISHYTPGKENETLARQIMEVKEHLRRIPQKGIGYGILKHLAAAGHKQDVSFTVKPQVVFNYLGQFDRDVENDSFFMAEESAGANAGDLIVNEYELAFNGMVVQERFNMSMIYSKKQFRTETVEALLQCFKSKLLQLVAFCTGIDEKQLTPSDLTYDDMSMENLDSIEALFD